MKYDELIKGEIYVTSYIVQGDYTFIFGFPQSGAINNESETKCRKTSGSSLHPPNGFKEFRLPTDRELYQFNHYLNTGCSKVIPLKEINFSYSIY